MTPVPGYILSSSSLSEDCICIHKGEGKKEDGEEVKVEREVATKREAAEADCESNDMILAYSLKNGPCEIQIKITGNGT